MLQVNLEEKHVQITKLFRVVQIVTVVADEAERRNGAGVRLSIAC